MSRRRSLALSDLPPHAQSIARVQLGPDSPLRDAQPKRAKPVQREAAEQRQVFAWADHPATRSAYPELAYLFHVANQGAGRSARQGAYLKAQGVRRGVPDLWLPIRRGPYLGCVLELKAAKGKPSPEQVAWMNVLLGEGWAVSVETGADAAIARLRWYLDGAET